MKKCQHCKTTKDLLINSKSKLKSGEIKYRYVCNTCNTKRARAYRKTEIGKRNVYKAVYKSTKKHWLKMLARQLLNYHVRVGHIKKPKICSKCKKRTKIEGHHPDYKKPLKVKWVCRKCHYKYYKK